MTCIYKLMTWYRVTPDSMNFEHDTVISRLWVRYYQTQNVNERCHLGHPRSITATQDHFICTSALWNCTQTATQIRHQLYTATGMRVSWKATRNWLHRWNFHVCCHHVIPRLTDHHITAWCCWYQDHQHWDNVHGSNVMFSDESRFTLDFQNRRSIVNIMYLCMM